MNTRRKFQVPKEFADLIRARLDDQDTLDGVNTMEDLAFRRGYVDALRFVLGKIDGGMK